MTAPIAPPFPSRPAKPLATRLPDGRYGVFIGPAYQFTDRAGIQRLRDQLDILLRDTADRRTLETNDADPDSAP